MKSRQVLITVLLVFILLFKIYFLEKKNYTSIIRTAEEFVQKVISKSNQTSQFAKESKFQGLLQDLSGNLSQLPEHISESNLFGRIPQSEVCVFCSCLLVCSVLP